MAARKLQQEMDRVFKRVSEGVQSFDAIYEKVQMSSNQSQKEKLEQDLKREIKKLQRLRDQIKTWMGSNDIKDKKILVEHRKLIESEMERFKACEKEMKTKAYSKEGLTSSARMDPREKEKAATANFISEMLEDLEHQVEALEAEQETTRNSMKRGKKDTSKQERISELEDQLDRHKWHIGKLELIMRMLENGNLSPEVINNIEEDIRYYVESNQEPDFAEDEEIYDELNLDDDEENFENMADEDDVPGHSLEDLAVEHEREKEASVSPTMTSASLHGQGLPQVHSPVSQASVLAGAQSHTHRDTSSTGSATLGRTHSVSYKEKDGNSSLPTATSSSNPTPAPLSRKNTFSSVAASVPAVPLPATVSTPTTAAASLTGMKPAPPPSRSTNELKYASAAAAAASAVPQGLSPLPPAPYQKGGVAGTAGVEGEGKDSEEGKEEGEKEKVEEKSEENGKDEVKEKEGKDKEAKQKEVKEKKSTSASSSSAQSSTPSSAPLAHPSVPIPETPKVTLPPGLRDLVNSFDAAKQRLGNPPPIASIANLLQRSYLDAPDVTAERQPDHYQPTTPYPTPSFYPSEPLSSIFHPSVFAKMDVDTLFYIFYYQQSTYSQYLAAKELKRRSWRFHKHFVTWFQRHEEPKAINNEYEQGTYRYFDFEGIWAQRRKQNFTFEYKYLEDEL